MLSARIRLGLSSKDQIQEMSAFNSITIPGRGWEFFSHHRVQNGSGAHPASNPMGTRGSFPGGKAAGAWSWPLTSI
jgi:hypothetical protein